MERRDVDLVIIGSGPAGQRAAIQAAKLGKKVAIVEKDLFLGGASLNSGTIPSKSLREAIIALTQYEQRVFEHDDKKIEVAMEQLSHRLRKVLEEQRELLDHRFSKNKIEILKGEGRFKSEHEVEVVDREGKVSHLVQAEFVIIAVGSTPRNPLGVPFDDEVILDSTRLLSMQNLPKTMIVLGGGIVGSEYASFFAALGVKVTVVDRKDRMLHLLDKEIGIHLQSELTQHGLTFLGNHQPKEILRKEDRAIVTFEEGGQLEADVLLFSLGRKADTQGLCLGEVGLGVNDYGYIPVNSLFQTSLPHIYAVGDVIGPPALASTSMEQGRLAARHAFSMSTMRFPDNYPVGIYTIPEISACGYTEEQLQELGFRYEVGRAYFYELARSHITGNLSGLFKILFHKDTLEILGIHIIGKGATEVIHIGQVAMSFNAKLDYFVNHIFNYPTYAEGYRIAAFNGLNKLKNQR